MRKLFRFGLLLVGLIAFPAATVAFLGGRYILRHAPEWAARMNARRNNRVSTPRSPILGWRAGRLPLDMNLDRSVRYPNGDVSISAAGIDGLVRGHARGVRGAEFSFKVDDPSLAARLSESAQQFGVRVSRDRKGGFVVRSRDAHCINEAAKAAFPARQVPVQREARQVRQYFIPGCSSFEEAQRKFLTNRDAFTPRNTYYEYTDTVEGKSSAKTVGTPLGKADLDGLLEPGCFVVNDESAEVYSGKMRVAGNLSPDAARSDALGRMDAFISSQGASLLPEKTSRVADATPEGVRRVVYLDNGGIGVSYEHDVKGSLESQPLVAWVECADFGKAAAIAQDGAIPEGSYLLVGRQAPPSCPGRHVVEFPLDAESLSRVTVENGVNAHDIQNARERGLDAGGLVLGDLRGRLDAPDSPTAPVTVRAREGIALPGGKVNGVPLPEFNERMGREDLPKLSVGRAERWSRDAGRIQSVTFSLNARTGMLTVTSVVDGQAMPPVERPVTEKEMDLLAKKGLVSEAEKKDILMRMYPATFKTYPSVGGKGLFKDPLGDWIAGRKPQQDPEVKRLLQFIRESQAPSQKMSKGNKIS